MRTTVNARTVEYEDVGQGIPLVLIHGYPLNRMVWQAQWEGLSDSARVIVPDLRGFGGSVIGAGPIDIGTYADDVRELLDALGIQGRAIICGLSMGGYIALAYERRYPDHVAALILANTKAGPDNEQGKEGRNKSIALANEKGASAIAEAMLPKMLSPKSSNNTELVAQVRRIMESATVPGIVAALESMRDRPDSTPTLLEFSAPTLIIAGADDQLFPLSVAQVMAQAARNSQLVILPDAGHISSMDQPAAFNQAVKEFLKGVGE